MKLIVGLGNPESRYANTRHNIGFDVAELVHKKFGLGMELSRFQAVYSKGEYQGERIIVARPQTYMNNSGIAVRAICDYFKIEVKDVIIICDDINLPMGALRIREKGSAGGHNGLKSIIAHLGSEEFSRVRVGVGQKPENWDLADYVLAKYTKPELEIMTEAAEYATKAIEEMVKNGAGSAMNKFNRNQGKQ